MDNKEVTLRVLESAIAKCAQTVLDGAMTVQEYEDATGRTGDELKKQIEDAARTEFDNSVEAIKAQMLAAAQAALDKLTKAGVNESIIEEIVGKVSVEDGSVISVDWSKVTK